MSGTQRLEFKDKKSQKFWEASLDGPKLLTRWGRIGTDGQSQQKKFKYDFEARRAMREQVDAKLKKGYRRAKTAAELELEKPPEHPSKRNPRLEQAVLDAPDDKSRWRVYSDWLQGEGDPRGELMALQIQLETKRDAKLSKRAGAILEQHAAALLGPLRAHPTTLDGKDKPVATWRRGFIDSLRISYNSYARDGQPPIDVPKWLSEVLEHPSAVFVREIVLAEYNTGDWDKKRSSSQVYQHLTDQIVDAAPRALERLVVGEYEFPDETEISWTWLGSVGGIWKVCPKLKSLTMQGGSIALGTIDAPSLTELTLRTGGLPGPALKSLAAAAMPKLERLEVWLGTGEYGGEHDVADLAPLLTGKLTPKLTHLGLKNAQHQDEVAILLAKAPIVKQLTSLDLSMGCMTDDGALALAKGARGWNLQSLDVSENYLSSVGIAAVKKLANKVNVKSQREADDDGDGTVYRYVSVGE